jgi:hypothetical protein
LITPMISGEECRAYNSSLCSLLHSPVTSFLLGPYILLSILFWNTLSLCFLLSVTNQASHPYKTAGKITVLYILIFIFLDTKLEDKILHWMIASIPLVQSALNFFINGISIVIPQNLI